jgi:ribosomal protein S18 acetylase RimI-like enzyme
MNFNIRKATLEDADGMAMVHVTSWQQTYRGLIHQDFIRSSAPSTKVRTCFYPHNAKTRLLLKPWDKSSDFAGMESVRDTDMTADTGEIWGMYLISSYHGRGWGKAFDERCPDGVALAGI